MKVNGVEICVDTLGSSQDPAILLIAGAASAMDWWPDGFRERLADAGRYVIRFDTRDTGQSESYPPGKPGYTFNDLVADAVGVLDGLDVEHAQVVGVSMGGALAQLIAARHPERVDSLVLIATSPAAQIPGEELPGMSADLRAFFEGRPAPDYTDRDAMVENTVAVMRQFEGARYFDEDAVRATAGHVFDRTRNMAASEQNHMSMADTEDAPLVLSDIVAPTLVLHGTDDPLFRLPHGEALARAIPHSSFLAVDGMGHQTPPAGTWDQVVPRMLALAG
ncbi:MAG TPA: alpha/beta hydrolase [Micromonosporaceae bacterium]